MLFFDAGSSSVAKPFFRDSIIITYYGNDSVLIKNYFQNDYFQNLYFFHDNFFYEKRFVTDLPGNVFEMDTILTFAKKDTVFDYLSKRDDFIVTLIDVSLFNSKYSIEKDENEYKTRKQSMIDTTYKEEFFYDENYRIYKFVNTWRGDKCVYLKKE